MLAGRPEVDVTLIDRNNFHTFQPLLYQVATSNLEAAEVCPTLRSIFRDIDKILLGEVTSVDPSSSSLHLEGEEILYDYLVMAIGGRTTYFGNEDWRERTISIKELQDALTVRAHLLKSFEMAEREVDPEKRAEYLTTVIVGGGPTGVELAGAIAELRSHALKGQYRNFHPEESRIVLVEALPKLLPGMPDGLADYTKQVLEDKSVEVLLESTVERLEIDTVHTPERTIRARNIIWAAGVEGYPLAEDLRAEVTKKGTVKVSDDLRLRDHPNVFCAGDMTHLKGANGQPLPGLAPVAMQQGKTAAENILRLLDGKETEDFHYHDRGTMAVIGRTHAVAELFGKLPLKGTVAWLAWLFVHLLFLVGYRNKAVVLIRWIWAYLGWKKSARVLNTIYLQNDPQSGKSAPDQTVAKPSH